MCIDEGNQVFSRKDRTIGIVSSIEPSGKAMVMWKTGEQTYEEPMDVTKEKAEQTV